MELDALTSTIDDYVYRGIWINRANGNVVKGATLTLDRASGALLIAFMAMYVGAAGRAFWKIARFFLHYALSSATQHDAIYHQQQAILCNSETALDALWILTKASVAWRNRARRSFSRFFPASILAFVTLTAFTAAG